MHGAIRRSDWVLERFSLPISEETASRTFELCRVLFGLGMLHRYVDILGFVVLTGDPIAATDDALTASLFSAAICVGLATPLALFGLMFYSIYPPFGFTLGHQMMTLVCWALLFAGAGRRLSVDAWIVRRPSLARAMGALYFLAVGTGKRAFAGLRLMILLLYGSISFGALAYHFEDELWWRGQVLHVLSTMPYMTDYASVAAGFRDAYPGVYDYLSTAGLTIQCTLELLLIPLCLFRWGRVFVALQWLGFILVRAAQINLGYLCYTELVMWLMCFGYMPLTVVLRGQTGAPFTDDAGCLGDSGAGRIFRGFLVTAAAVAVYFNVVNTAQIGAPDSGLSRLPYPALVFRVFGQWPVNVFNEDDLALGNGQLVLCETDADGKVIRTVPYLDHRGGRLGYLRNDLMYFGTSLPWQRAPRGVQLQSAPWLATRVAMLDALLQAPSDRHYMALHFVQSREPFHGYQAWTEPELLVGFRFTLPVSLQSQVQQRLSVPVYDLPPGHVGQGWRRRETTRHVRALQRAGELDAVARLPMGPGLAH